LDHAGRQYRGLSAPAVPESNERYRYFSFDWLCRSGTVAGFSRYRSRITLSQTLDDDHRIDAIAG
jgi:hypothetical protein